MADYAVNYQKAIQLLTEDQFREFVLLYNKNHYNAIEGNITDGPYDGGIDLVIRQSRRVRKLNIQVTVQKEGIDKKVFGDIKKASENVDRFEYIGTLYFFINQPVSNESQNKWIEEARKNEIELIVYDSKALSDITASQKELRDYLSRILSVVFPKEQETIDYATRVLYDAISQQRGVNAVKESIVKAYIQQILFDGGPSSVVQITDKMEDAFPKVFTDNYYQMTVGRMKKAGLLISIDDNRPKLYDLSEDQRIFFESLQIREQASRSELLDRFTSVCSEFGIELSFEVVYDFVQRMYDDVYNVDLVQLSKESGTNKGLKRIHNTFIDYLKNQCPSAGIDFACLARQLLTVFEVNDSLGKQSASKLLIGMFRSNHLDDYLASTKRVLLLDTPVLIQYICCLFKDMPDYDYPPYQYVRTLKIAMDDLARSPGHRVPVSAFTLDGYMNEVVAHLCDAIQVGRFLSRPEIRILGRSRNSFYNFYEEVLRREEVGGIDDYVEFILGIDDLSVKRSLMEEQIHKALEDSLRALHFQINNHIEVENWTELRRTYDFALVGTSGENKTSRARNNDLNAILYQAFSCTEDAVYPYFVTWDNSFIPAREALKKSIDGMDSWFLYSPQQLASTLSLLDFKVNPEFVTTSILSVVEDTIAENADVKSLLDIVSEFLDGTGDSEMRVASRIASIKRSLYEASIDGNGAGNEVPVDSLLCIVLNQARTSKEKYSVFEALMSSYEDLSGFVSILNQGISSSIDGVFSEEEFRKEIDEYLSGFEFE